jgi:hypothetical protein
MFFCWVCCVLSGRGLCDELITRPRGVLPTVACRCVWSRNLVWRGGHSPRWAAVPEKIKNNVLDLCCALITTVVMSALWLAHRDNTTFLALSTI